MTNYLESLINEIRKPGRYLLIISAVVVLFFILLSNVGWLPLQNIGDFVFFSALTLLLAIYRPGWAFLFFVGSIALENVNLAPPELGLAIRPYQFIGGLALLGVLTRLLAKRLPFALPKFSRCDYLIIIFAAAGFVSALGAANKFVSLKQAVIAATFATLYFLGRIFIQSASDLKKIIPFFLSSSLMVVLYGIWQNARFQRGWESFEVMPGRPNATFTEPDWLGAYLALAIAVIYALIYYFNKKSKNQESEIFNFKFLISKLQILKTFLYAFLVLVYVLLILTVARSAWLAALAATFAFLFIILTDLKFNWKTWYWKNLFQTSRNLAIAIICSIGIIYFFNLTNFQLFNRAQSTASGLQKITIACPGNLDVALPEKINDLEELNQYDCRHIDLEEIEKEKSAGQLVMEIYRPDPNVNIRAEIYRKSWEEIKKNPILGIGWGNIEKVLGQDARGAGLNASNIFLEVWLGSGLAGLLAFLTIWGYAITRSLRKFLSENSEEKTLGLFILLGIVALIVFNLFNAGIFLGILWLFFAIVMTNRD